MEGVSSSTRNWIVTQIPRIYFFSSLGSFVAKQHMLFLKIFYFGGWEKICPVSSQFLTDSPLELHCIRSTAGSANKLDLFKGKSLQQFFAADA